MTNTEAKDLTISIMNRSMKADWEVEEYSLSEEDVMNIGVDPNDQSRYLVETTKFIKSYPKSWCILKYDKKD